MGEPCVARHPAASPGEGPPAAAPDIEALRAKAPEAAAFLRLLANPRRLLLLCHLAAGERSVAGIQRDLGLGQPALSQQLATLRQAGLVRARRQSRSIHYTIADGRARAVVAMLHAIFRGAPAARPGPGGGPDDHFQPGSTA